MMVPAINVTSVLIVGAGPSGLVFALTLAKYGINVRIIEKSPTPQRGSRGSGIMPRSQELLHFLGVLKDVQTQGASIPPMQSYKQPGGIEPLDTWEFLKRMDPSPSRPHTSVVECRQELLEGTLRNHLQHHGINVEFGTQLETFEQTNDGVTARLVQTACDQSQSVEVVVRSTYLVGADGARGTVRKVLGLTFLGESREADGLVVGDVDAIGLSRDWWHMWGAHKPGSNQVITLRPCGAEPTRFAIFSTGSFIHEADMTNPDNFRELFARHTGRNDIILDQFHWLSYFKNSLNLLSERPHMRMVNKFGEGRVFVVGDAAHVHSPTGGQGLNSSVQDAFNLAWKLAIALKHSPPSAPPPTTSNCPLLASYTSERLPVIAEMLRQTSNLHTLTFQGGELTRHQSGWQRAKHLLLLELNYRWSEVVRDERTPRVGVDSACTNGDGSSENAERALDELRARSYYTDDTRLRAGDRAPDAPGLLEICPSTGEVSSEAVSLFDLVDVTKHMVLVFPGNTSDNGQAFLQSTLDTLAQVPPEIARAVAVLPSGASSFAALNNFGDTRAYIDENGHAHSGYQVCNGKGDAPATQRTIVIIRPDGVVGAIAFSGEGVKKYFGIVFAGLG